MLLAINGPVFWANVWGLAFGLAVGFLAGHAVARLGVITRHLGSRPRNHTQQSVLPRFYTPGGELELFTTTTPAMCPPNKEISHHGQPYAITRLVDLGGFTDLQGTSHHQWRVYGRPA